VNINELLKFLVMLGNPNLEYTIFSQKDVLTLRIVVKAGVDKGFDLLTARGEIKRFKTLRAALIDLKTIDPGLNENSVINFKFIE
jgi:hypothetical protein